MNKADFPILKQQVHGRELVYLDNAATSQKPQPVLDAIVEAYSRWNSNIHRGVHHLSQVATSKHEGARQAVADFINAREAEEIVFTKGTTDAINALAFAIGEAFISKGDEIIVSGVEHHSNIVPWQMLCERKKAVLRHIPLREDLSLDLEAFRGLLSDRGDYSFGACEKCAGLYRRSAECTAYESECAGVRLRFSGIFRA